MVYRTILLIGTVLSAVHAVSYAHHLWKRGKRRPSLIIGGTCLAAVLLACDLIMQA